SLMFFALRAHSGSGRPVIAVTDATMEALRTRYQEWSGHLPSKEKERQLVRRYVDEEILYREALRLGLDKGDPVIARRLTQKIEFLLEDLAFVPEPTPRELEAYFEKHRARYEKPPRLSMLHVFVSGDDPHALQKAVDLKAKVKTDAERLGDPF